MHQRHKFLLSCAAVGLGFSLMTGCGSEGGSHEPLTASKVTSATTESHTHTADIPLIDVNSSPASGVYQYRSAETNGHSHVIALSSDQMDDLTNGKQVTVTSSAPNTGADHTHTWTLVGGNVLYDKYCYGCHGGGKRAHKPMKVKLNSAQSAAIRQPMNAPVSNAPAAIPDPAYNAPAPGTELVDGAVLYDSSCASCHGPLATSSKRNRTAAQTRSAITGNVGGMGYLSPLTDAQLEAIATELAK